MIDEPNVLLFDEPITGVDIHGEEVVYELLRGLQEERKMTILLITHDLHVIRDVERLHGTIKERTKVMRGMDTDKSAEAMLEGNRLYYNYIRPHQALDGQTPAEKAGIDLNLEGNKWKELIRERREPRSYR